MRNVLVLAAILAVVCACQQALYPSPVQFLEATREVTRVVPITVQVTQIVRQTVEVTSVVENRAIVTATLEPTATEPPPTATPSPTETGPTSTPTSPPLGSRSNPVPFGEVHEFIDYDVHHVTLRLVDTMRGQDALSITGHGPAGDNEFYMAKFEIAHVRGPADEEWPVIYSEFGVEADLRPTGTAVLIFEDGMLNATSLYPGGQDSGWVCFVIPEGADVTGVYFESWDDQRRIWFAVDRSFDGTRTSQLTSSQPPEPVELAPTPTPVPPPTAVPVPTSVPVGSRSHPVHFGQAHEFVDGKGRRISLRLVSTARGQQAHQIVNAGGSPLVWNPREGTEFCTATFEASYLVGPSDKLLQVEDGDFGIEASRERIGHTVMSADGVLDGAYYPGGGGSGWVLFQIPIGSEINGVYYGPWLEDIEIWFAVQ